MTQISFDFSEKESRKYNIIGLRATYGLTLFKIKKSFENLSVFTADTSTSAGLDRFRNKYPNNFFDCGIAEQCMISTAAGYVEDGGVALASTFAPFLIFRSAEQVRLTMGYMKLPLIITGLASGVSLAHLGYTHCCVEDLSLILNIPNILTYIPTDCYELNQILPHLIKLRRPIYIRLTGLAKMKPLHKENFSIDFFSPLKIFTGGSKLVIFSNGAISSNVLEAIKKLSNIDQQKIDFYILPFIDQQKSPKVLAKIIKNYNNILILDEGMYGGFASFINKVILENNFKIKSHCNVHPNQYLDCGSYQFMLKKCGLDIESIYSKIKNIVF